MIVLIDAYNVLKRQYSDREISEHIRNQFIARLRQYAQLKSHSIILVFDGGDSPWPSVNERGVVEIVYSGYNKSADDVIKNYLDENKQKDIVLVSSDTQLNRYAEGYSIVSVDADAFYMLFKASLEKKQTGRLNKRQYAIKTSQDSNPQLDELMIQMGAIYDDEHQAVEHMVIKNTQKDDRYVKRLKQVIRKL